MTSITKIARFAAASVFLLACMNTVLADEPRVFTGRGKFAINGYDAVAYHEQQRPVKGKSKFTAEWDGATWRFASAENRDRFASAPQRWAPEYGGYCAWAVSNGYTAKTDPDAWTIHEGKLYLNYSIGVRSKWSEDIPGNVKRGDANWPGVLSK